MTMRRSAALALFCLLVAVAAPAQQAPTVEKGFAPDKVFHLDDFDSINTFNGNLAIHIPIGPVYPVSSALSYGLTLFYNSKVWDWEQQLDGNALALPNRHSDAGMGWQISLGRLEGPNAYANDTPAWVYEGSDGGEHALTGQLHPGVPQTSGIVYSTDSSYMRASVTSGPLFAELPDGTIQYFDGSGRVTNISDQFGNYVVIDYIDSSPPAPCSTGDTAQWHIHDSQGVRNTYVCLSNQFLAGTIWVPTNYQSVYDGGFVTKIVMDAPPDGNGANRTSTYTFNYVREFIYGPCLSDDMSAHEMSMLQSVALPDGSQYSFTYNPSGNSCENGTLASMTLPTGATVAYGYTKFNMPVEVCDAVTWFDQVIGVATKTVTGPKIPTAVWTFTQTTNRSSMNDNVKCPARRGSGTSCKKAPPDQMIATVTDPLGNVSEHFYSIWPGSASGIFDPSDAFCQTAIGDGPISELGSTTMSMGSHTRRRRGSATLSCCRHASTRRPGT